MKYVIVFLLIASVISNAATQELQLEEINLSATENQVSLIITGELDQNQTYNVHYSHDLVNWIQIDQISLTSGTGSLTWTSTPEQRTDKYFVRLSTPDGFSHILNLPGTPHNYSNITLPDHLLTAEVSDKDNTPANNPITDEGSTLGRVLFYDTQLSINRSISCASCHIQENGFSDPRTLSVGFQGGHTARNSIGLANSMFYKPGHFFWDERADTLEDQVLMPIQDSVEMGMSLPNLITRLQGLPYYAPLFESTFGDTDITSNRISRALSQFVRSMLSYQSKYDQGVPNNFSNFTDLEREGLDLFNGSKGSCSECHSGPNFVGNRPENNGLEYPYIDLGVGGVTLLEEDEGKFKIPSLRNIEKTAPYMHDGRMSTLEDVINHYSLGILPNPNLGDPLRSTSPIPLPIAVINFTDHEKLALISFLKTLTDEAFLSNPIYSDPFVR